ncbi:MAG: protein kinase [Lachnospiraceae bacterium]
MRLCPNCFSSAYSEQGVCSVCGFRDSGKKDARVLPAGVTLNRRYIVGKTLGIGGFGITYVAYDMRARIRVAVKEYFPAEWAMRMPKGREILPNSQSKENVYRHGQEVFLNEAKVLCRLKNLPNVVNVRDFFVENGTAYMVMELLEGDTLSGYMRRHQLERMSYQMAGRIIKDVGISLTQVHSQMLLHRDIGPDNIMLINGGRDVKLIDFGATRMYALNSEKSMSVLIKPGFAPIEQYSRTGNQGPWTDVYALAATYYFLLTGEKPPEAPERVAGVQIPSISKKIPDIPRYIEQAVFHALELNWRKRTRTINGFLRELRMIERPILLMRMAGRNRRYDFMQDDTITVGRNEKKSNIILREHQVSSVHCKVLYDPVRRQFLVRNYSVNRTYTSRGILEKNRQVYLRRHEWFYIQTTGTRYLFYLEVE